MNLSLRTPERCNGFLGLRDLRFQGIRFGNLGYNQCFRVLGFLQGLYAGSAYALISNGFPFLLNDC